ncbi:MAG: PocR ligand-binding domain-containing protein [Syntrophomonadaceae bacterium]|nr:PocR ligand-binding domain-containing protein [Syntrophomonadaceae bacterium]
MPEPGHFLNLLDVVPPDFLKDLLHRFTEATGVKTLITDNLGKPLIWPDCPSGLYCDFCDRMRANLDTSLECEKSDAFGGISAFHKGLPFIYRCHMDFVEVAVPIIISNQYLGVIMIGQVRVEEDEHNSIVKNISPNIDLESNPELKSIYKKSQIERPLIPLEKLRALANMLHSIANYIAEISLNSILKDANNQLSMRIQHEEHSKIELERNLKQKEVHSMERSLKPQYLFNVLNTINNLILLENPQRASEVISSLSKIMRYNLRHTDQFSTIGEEVEAIHDYLKIQQLSSEDKISIQTSVGEDCMDAIIPPFSIQPFVENAFQHGLEAKLRGGTFYLEVSKLGSKIKIIVSDNGVGMSTITKSQLMALKKSDFSNTESFPLINSIKILNHYFEDEFSWDIKSYENQGTTIDIVIPYLPKERGGINNG